MSVYVEQQAALLDVQNICHEYGSLLVFNQRQESDVVRDEYSSIKTYKAIAAPKSIYAWPVIYDPSDKELQKLGLLERYPVLVYTPTKDWTDIGLGFNDIDMLRWNLVLDNADYKIAKKQKMDRFGDVNLYIVLGLEKQTS